MLKSLKDENMVKVYITNVDDFIHYKDNSPHNHQNFGLLTPNNSGISLRNQAKRWHLGTPYSR